MTCRLRLIIRTTDRVIVFWRTGLSRLKLYLRQNQYNNINGLR